MTSRKQGPEAGKADHGAPSELTWRSGKGRQPYGNQGPEAASQHEGGEQFSAGDRDELSGRNLEQLERVKRRP